jgi:hypothetical protein
MDFQKIASILFCVNVKYVSVNDNEVIDIMGHDCPPVIDQSQDATILVIEQHLVLIVKLCLVFVVEQQLIHIFDIC